MPEAGFFTRVRGKISGPYGIDALRRMIRMGMLSKVHEISADRTAWARRGDYEDLFPSPAPSPSSPSPQDDSQTAEPYVLPAADPFDIPLVERPSDAAGRYYYAQNGTSVGPIAISVLKALAQNGTLGADDLCWREDAETSTPARQMPALAAFYSARSGGTWQPEMASRPPVLSYRRARGVSAQNTMVSVLGIVVGAVILLCMLLPWFSVKTGYRDFTFFSWDFYKLPGAGAMSAIVTYLFLAGAALCIVSPLTRGVARGASFVGVAGGGLLFFLVVALSDSPGGDSAEAIFSMLFFVSLAVIAGVCAARGAVADSAVGPVPLGIFSGLAALGLLVCFIMAVSKTHDFPTGATSSLPGSIVFALVMMIAGAAAGLATSIMGFIGLNPIFSPGLNRATGAAAAAGIALPLLGLLVAVLGIMELVGQMSGGTSSRGVLGDLGTQVTLIVIRILLVWCAMLVVLGMGISELLVANSRTGPTGQKRSM